MTRLASAIPIMSPRERALAQSLQLRDQLQEERERRRLQALQQAEQLSQQLEAELGPPPKPQAIVAPESEPIPIDKMQFAPPQRAPTSLQPGVDLTPELLEQPANKQAIEQAKQDELFRETRERETEVGEATGAPLARFNQIRAEMQLPEIDALPLELISDTPKRIINALQQSVSGFAQAANRAVEGVGDLLDATAELAGVDFDPPTEFFEANRNVIRAFLPDDPRLRGEFLSSELPGMLGVTTAFFALGATGGLSGVIGGGAALNAQEMAETARAEDIEGRSKAVATLLAGAVGTTESAFPLRIFKVLKPIDRAVKGKLFNAILTRGGFPVDVATETIQEIVQQGGNNIIAKTVLGIDRPLTEGVFEAGKGGAAVSVIFSGLARLAGLKIRASQERAVRRLTDFESQAREIVQERPEVAQRLLGEAQRATETKGPRGVPGKTVFEAEGITSPANRTQRREFVDTLRSVSQEIDNASRIPSDQQQPQAEGKKEIVESLRIGQRVRPSDRRNVGTIISLSDDGARARVEFFNRKTQLRAIKTFSASQLQVIGQKRKPKTEKKVGKPVPRGTRVTTTPTSVLRDIPDPTTLHNDAFPQASPRPYPMPTRLEAPKGAIKAIASPQVIDSFVKAVRAFNVKFTIPIRVGRVKAKTVGGLGVLGVWKLPSAVIRIRQANDITTAAHEVGHAIEFAAFGNPKAGLFSGEISRKRLKDELEAMGKELYGETEPNGGYVREGFAEFIHFYLTNPSLLQTRAPRTLRWFEKEFLSGYPLGRKMLLKARESASRFAQQGSITRAVQSIVDPHSVKQRFARATASAKRATSFQTHVDALDPIFTFTKEAESLLGRKLSATESPAFAASALRQVEAARLEQMITEGMIDFAANPTGGPSLKQIGAIIRGKRNRRKFTIFLWAKRAESLWLDPNKPKGRNPGLTLEDAQQIIKEIDTPQMQLAAGQFYDWWNGVMNYAAQASPTFAEAVERIRSVDPGNYIPLQREFRELDGIFASSSSSARKGTLGRRLLGSGRRILDPIPQSVANARAILTAAHKRYVLDAMLKLSRVDGMGHLIERVPRSQIPVASRTIKELVAEIDKRIQEQGGKEKIGDALSKDVLEEVVTFFSSEQTAKNGEPIIPIVENGKLVFYQVDPRLFEALNHLENINLRQIHWLAEWAGRKPAQVFRLGTTGLRASFGLVTNPARDVQTLWVNSQANGNGFQLFYSWMRSMIGSALRTTTGKREPYFDAFMRLGGQMAQPLFFDVDTSKSAAANIFRGRIVQVADPRNWVNWLRELIQIPESATRVAELRLIAKDIGWEPGQRMSLDQSFRLLLASKQVTVDFTAAGTFAANVNRVVPFYNAAIQGPRANLRAMRRNPTKFLIRALTALTIPTLLLWWRNKDEDWYKEMPAKEKSLFWNIAFGDDTLFRFPRSFEIGQFFASLPEALIDSWYRNDPEAVKEWFPVAFEVLAPDIRPVLVRETMQQFRNFDDFWDRPIVSERLKRKPPQEQVGVYTSRAAQFMGDAFKVSPQRVDHAIRGIGGGVATDIVSVLGIGPKNIDREAEAADAFVIGRMFRRGGSSGGQKKSIAKMYDFLDKAQIRQASDRVKETEPERQQRLLLADAARAVSNLLYVRAVEQNSDRRRLLSTEALQIAKQVVGQAKSSTKITARDMKTLRAQAKERLAQTQANRMIAKFLKEGASGRGGLFREFKKDFIAKHPKTKLKSRSYPKAAREFRRAMRDAGV